MSSGTTIAALYSLTRQALSALSLQEGDINDEQIDAECRLIIEEITAIHPNLRLLAPCTPITDAQREKIEEILEKRVKQRVPIQYLLGKADFMGLSLNVSPDVLIPRPETEWLANFTLQEAELLSLNQPQRALPVQILDIGTGSGAIALYLKQKLGERAEVTAVDLCPKALAVAQENARKLKLNLSFMVSDCFSAIEGDKRFDIIVSNPPYIGQDEKGNMLPEVLSHEPHMALFAPDNDRESIYRIIANAAKIRLNLGGYVFVELGQGLSQNVSALFKEQGFTNIEVFPDLAGIPRILKASWKQV